MTQLSVIATELDLQGAIVCTGMSKENMVRIREKSAPLGVSAV